MPKRPVPKTSLAWAPAPAAQGRSTSPASSDQPPAATDSNAQPITYLVRPPLSNDPVNRLFAAAWPAHQPTDFQSEWAHSLAWVAASSESELIGYVNLAWDGGIHAFLLNTTVHPRLQRHGIGRELVKRALAVATEHHIEWVHVDYEPEMEHFYAECGFRPTRAGLARLAPADS